MMSTISSSFPASHPRDDGESIAAMEPLLLRQELPERISLQELASELVMRSTGLQRSLPKGIARALSNLVRSMNCYYSNLIEGHNTHPIEIERALKSDFSSDTTKRNLQLEACAHIKVQEWIDSGALTGKVACKESLKEIHLRFCRELPDDLQRIKGATSSETLNVDPGEFRKVDVQVGVHIPISPGAIERFLNRFEQVYLKLGKLESCLALAAMHHRLLWIHPFLDGNGRVARLLAHALLLEAADSQGLWSIARGFARRVQEYKNFLAHCDQRKRNDLDGRGTLSEEALIKFTRFSLDICLDQVSFMESLIQPERLRSRIMTWVKEESALGTVSSRSPYLLEALLYRGELPRSEVPSILDVTERQARRVVSALFEREVLSSDSTKAPLRLAFPATLADRWMPGLFPHE